MKRLFTALIAIIPLFSLGSAHADQSGAKNEWAALPINGLVMASKEGKIRLVSDNGRFVIDGKLYDTWNKEFVETLDQAHRTMSYIDLKKMNLNVDDLAPFTYGKGPKQVTVFIDPYCQWCKKLIGEMKGLEKEYTFKILPIPVLGDRSNVMVRTEHCAADRNAAYAAATTGMGYDDLKADPTKPCDTEALGKRLITAQLFGIKGVPYMIRDDGLVHQGFTSEGLVYWLKSEAK